MSKYYLPWTEFCRYGWGGYGQKEKDFKPPNLEDKKKDPKAKAPPPPPPLANTTDYRDWLYHKFSTAMSKMGAGWGDTHGHTGWRCKKPKNLEWWRHLDKDMTGQEGMVSSELDPMYLIKKEYKTVADVYCDEWEVPAWFKFSE